jgi:hypothetical protein
VAEPEERFRAIHEEIATLKAKGQAAGMDRLFGALGKAPAPMQKLLGATLSVPNPLAHLVCTNVPGPRQPLYCAGHRMIEHYPWVPLGWRMGMGVAVMSYDQSLAFSITADRKVMHDLERLGGFVRDGFDEVRAAAGKRRGRRKRAVVAAQQLHAVRPEATGRNGAAPERVRAARARPLSP